MIVFRKSKLFTDGDNEKKNDKSRLAIGLANLGLIGAGFGGYNKCSKALDRVLLLSNKLDDVTLDSDILRANQIGNIPTEAEKQELLEKEKLIKELKEKLKKEEKNAVKGKRVALAAAGISVPLNSIYIYKKLKNSKN